MKKILSLAAAAFFASANIAQAQEDSSSPAAGSKGTLDLTGYVDTYYQYNLNRPASGFNTGRIFDLNHNQFNLGLVQTMFTYSKDRVTVVADLTFGPNADLGNFGNEGTARFIKQAFIAYDLSDKFTFTIGQFGTHIGYELIDAPLNYNYSLSYLFGNGPFYHTGAKLDYSPSDRFGLMLGVLNGWDGLQDFNDKKSIAAQVFVSPVEGFEVYANWIGGDEYNTLSAFGDHAGSFTSLFDLTTSYNISDAVKIGFNGAYGSFKTGASEVFEGDPWSKDATWKGGALYLNFNTSETFGFGVRGEYFSDPSGVRYFGPVDVKALTLTADIKLAKGKFNIKPELRHDVSKDNFFEDNLGYGKKNQTTVGAAFIYSFNASILK
jgi:hypothetical protein